MTDVLAAKFGSSAWGPFQGTIPGVSRGLLLLDVATGFTKAREIVSNKDRNFVAQAVYLLYPDDKLLEIVVGGKRYLVRHAGANREF